MELFSCADLENSVLKGLKLFSVINVFTERHTDLSRETIGPKGPIASRGGSVPVFLK